MTNLELQSLRASVDDVDAKIVDLLSSRFLITSKIGKLKALYALDAIDPQREAAQEARFRELAQRGGLNADLVVRIFRNVIDEVVSNHRKA
jgi:chorismate mutase